MTNTEKTKFYITKEDGSKEEFSIGPEGSLGILALGAVGIKAWKQAKAKVRKEKKLQNKKEKENGKKS
jgi:hypothetical protein